MPRPTMRSGHAERVAAVTSPAATMATFAKTSLRAERNAARVRLLPYARKRANMSAQERLTASAPKAGERERHRRGRHRQRQLLPRRPERREAGGEQDAGQRHPD